MKRALLGLVIPLAIAATACTDKAASEKAAADEVAKLVTLVKTDVDQVRNGLPAGAKKLGELLDTSDPGADPAGVQRALQGARASVKDLAVAKSTFFSFTDANGVVVRSEADPDLLEGKNVITAFPALKKATEAASGVVEAYGEMTEMRGLKVGQDTTWVVAHPVKSKDNQVKGLFLTGWSFRRFAFHLEDAAHRELNEIAEKEGKKGPPISYVFAVKGTKAYGAPLTPDVNAQALEALGIVEKTKAGPFKTTIEVTGRSFAVAAQAAPELGPDAAVAILLSEI